MTNEQEIYDMVLQPKNVRVPLFEHQRRSIYKMQELEDQSEISITEDLKMKSCIGVNSDPTGYGKTLSMVGLVALDKMKWDLNSHYIRNYLYSEYQGITSSCRVTKYDKLPCTLVLVSQSIVAQWIVDFEKSDLNVISILSRKDIDNVDVENYDVIVVSLTMYNGLMSRYSGHAWKRFIFDEPGHVRVVGMKPIVAGFTWLVTATPEAMVSTHINCKNSFMKNILRPAAYVPFSETILSSKLTVRNSIEYVEKSFKMPATHHEYYKCYQPVLDAISGMVSSGIYQLVEAGNIEGAISALGGNQSSNGNIAELINNRKLEELEEVIAKIKIYTIRQDQKRVEEWQKRKILIDEEMEVLSNRFKGLFEEVCVICCDVKVKPIMNSPCTHTYCGECLLKWLKNHNSCPTCRRTILNTDLVYIKTDNSEVKTPSPILNKNQTIVKLLDENREGKFVIFSAYDETFNTLFTVLSTKEVKYNVLRGTSKHRENVLENFRNGDTNVLLLNSTVNAAGINLREATDIILYHSMNDSMMNQIIGRANRLGRNKDLRVHHLV